MKSTNLVGTGKRDEERVPSRTEEGRERVSIQVGEVSKMNLDQSSTLINN